MTCKICDWALRLVHGGLNLFRCGSTERTEGSWTRDNIQPKEEWEIFQLDQSRHTQQCDKNRIR